MQSPFSHPSLAGKSEQEIADLLALQDLTIKEQRTAVDGVGNQPAPAPEPESPPVEMTSAEFFENPAEHTRKIVSDTIQREMGEIVSELRQDMASGRAKTAWEEAAEQLPNLPNMRPFIEAVLVRNKITSPTLAQIIGSYDMAAGQAIRQGTSIPGQEAKTEPEPTPDNTRMIPQHRVSTQPIAQTEKKTEIVPLDENEARLARERGMSPEKYRALQEVDIADVVAPLEETS